jgi:HlyD family secretion protein
MRRILFLAVLIAAPGCIAGSGGRDKPAETPEEPRLVCVGHVDVEGGVVALRPVRSGRLVELTTHEGQDVRTGDVLLRLDDADARVGVRQAEAKLKAAKLRLEQVRKTPVEHQHDLTALRALLAAAESRLAAARQALARKQELHHEHQLGEHELKVAEEVVREMEATARAEKEKLDRLLVWDPKNAVAQAEAEVEVQQALLDQSRQALSQCTLRAPADGEVLRVLVSPGDVLATQTAVMFCPRQPRIVRAEVPQEFAGGVAVGQAAVIEDDSRPGQTWQGKVVRVSDWFTQRRSVLQEPQQRNDVRTLECIVAVEPDARPLRIGQRMRVILTAK